MSIIHIMIQGKGGVGKTLCSYLLAQYLRSKEHSVKCYDMDTVNASLMMFPSLEVQQISITDLNSLITQVEDKVDDIVIDTGATVFLAVGEYLNSQALTNLPHSLVLHTVVTGGQSALDTFNSVYSFVTNFPTLPLVVWLNPFWGPVELQGINFEDSKVFRDFKDCFHALISLPSPGLLFEKNFTTLLKRHQTFDEALSDPSWDLLSRQRLVMLKRQIWGALDVAHVDGFQ